MISSSLLLLLSSTTTKNHSRRRRQTANTVIIPKMVRTYISFVSCSTSTIIITLCLLLILVRAPDVVAGNKYIISYNDQQRKQRNCYAFQQTFTQKQQRNVLTPTTVTTRSSFQFQQPQKQQSQQTLSSLQMSYSTNSAPSDYDTEEWLERSKKIGVVQVVASTSSDDNNDNESQSQQQSDVDNTIRDALKNELLLLSAITNRGEYATIDEQNLLIDIVAQLEALNPTNNPATNIILLDGIWDLCLSSTQLFRSSPFFQSIRSILQELVDSNNGSSSTTNTNNLFNFNSNSIKATIDTAFDIHDRATTASRIGRVRQIIDYSVSGSTNTNSNNNNNNIGLITSEVDLEVGIVPGLPFRVKGTVITTAQIIVTKSSSLVTPPEEDTIELQIVSTSIRNSNIPIINQFLSDSSTSSTNTNAGRSGTSTSSTDNSINTILNSILGSITGGNTGGTNPNNNIQPTLFTIPNEIPVGQLYQTIFGRIPTIQLKTFYLDDTMRITRDQDDNFFIYTRA